nr:type II toxin-antitoxin system PemK/MazF family toxin [Clostridia bacterium]
MKRKHRPFNNIERGDIYLADLGTEDKIVGSEQCGVRPVIVTQCDYNNRKSPTIIV